MSNLRHTRNGGFVVGKRADFDFVVDCIYHNLAESARSLGRLAEMEKNWERIGARNEKGERDVGVR